MRGESPQPVCVAWITVRLLLGFEVFIKDA
jgi:hypothetical protein